jgi:hypothetical protein
MNTERRQAAPAYLRAKEAAAIELYRAGKISRGEAFRHEVEASIGEFTDGPIVMRPKASKAKPTDAGAG